MNSNYGKLNYGVIEYAPNNVRIGDTIYAAPTAEQYADCGWLQVVTDNQPTGKLGVYYTPSGWEQNETQIQRTWAEHQIDAPVSVHRYSKLKLITAAKAKGKWDALKEWIANAGLADEWTACMYLSDDYAGFDQIKAAAVAAGFATEEEVNSILAAAEDETINAGG